jgi:Sulfatase
MKVRPFFDELIVDKATDYIKRNAGGEKPFFTYVRAPMSIPRRIPHPDFNQTDPSRLGLHADLMAEMDYRVGRIVGCVEQAGIADDTLIVISSDNAALDQGTANAWGGSNGRSAARSTPRCICLRCLARSGRPKAVPDSPESGLSRARAVIDERRSSTAMWLRWPLVRSASPPAIPSMHAQITGHLVQHRPQGRDSTVEYRIGDPAPCFPEPRWAPAEENRRPE